MSAATYNLIIDQGTTWTLNLAWKDSNGAALNLTGYRIHAHFRQTLASATTVLDLDSAAPITGCTFGSLDATGTIAVTLSATLTAALTTSGVYDLQAISAGGVTTRVVEGTFTLHRAVTHA